MRNGFWYFLLLLLFVAGDRLGGSVLQKAVAHSQFRFARLYAGEAGADILLMGNSRGLTFYQPYIEQITGKSTCNLSYNGLPMDAANALIQDYLDRYSPKKLILDITMCDRENDALLAGFLQYTDRSERLNDLIYNKLPLVWWGGRVSSLFQFNNEIFQRALFYRHRSDKDWLLDRTISGEQAARASENAYDLKINPYLIEQLRQSVAAARAKGVQVELVIAPYLPGFQIKHLDDLKYLAETSTGLPVHDYRAALNDIADFGDFMHPNQKGSTAYLDSLQRDGVFDGR